MAKLFQVRETIGTLPHIYAEFKQHKDAAKYMRDLMDTSKFDIVVVNTKEEKRHK